MSWIFASRFPGEHSKLVLYSGFFRFVPRDDDLEVAGDVALLPGICLFMWFWRASSQLRDLIPKWRNGDNEQLSVQLWTDFGSTFHSLKSQILLQENTALSGRRKTGHPRIAQFRELLPPFTRVDILDCGSAELGMHSFWSDAERIHMRGVKKRYGAKDTFKTL